MNIRRRTLTLVLVTLTLLVLSVLACWSQLNRITHSVPLSECQFSVERQRSTREIANGMTRVTASNNLKIIVLTVRVKKPKGKVQFHNSDFVLAYPNVTDPEWDDRSRCTGIRNLGTSGDAESGWVLPSSTGGYIGVSSEGSNDLYLDLAFFLEDEARQVELCVAHPTSQVRVQ